MDIKISDLVIEQKDQKVLRRKVVRNDVFRRRNENQVVKKVN